MFYDTAWWDGIVFTGILAWVGFMVCDVLRYRSVRGTHTRYVWTTAQWAFAYPALGFPVMSLVEDLARRQSGAIIADAVLIFLWALHYRMLRNSDDDNWFKRTGKRLRRWARENMPSLSPLPQGAGA
jgi:hypothetical protein